METIMKKEPIQKNYIKHFIFILLIALTGVVCVYFFILKPAAGDPYQNEIQAELTERYGEGFIFVGMKHSGNAGNPLLIFAPEREKDMTFYAKSYRYNGEEEIEENYIFTNYLYHSPAVYGINAGVQIDRDELFKEYDAYLSRDGWEHVDLEDFYQFLNHSKLMITDINETNIESKAKVISSILNDYAKIEPFSRYMPTFKEDQYLDIGLYDLWIPYQMTDEKDVEDAFYIPKMFSIWDILHIKDDEDLVQRWLQMDLDELEDGQL
ncbi:hypothetical protein [Mesobacillus subterraneus]|uniref:Uncharacterized protein n=1 Tax=Mesobacillus subterraneus TaxID=285983 RepID=A0A3R9KYB0_9BACI|nr:hypothetical protein [Mesobacillus subterraneus]RSD28832.1 hypothetical protein EJA10_04475 [Mesobacillus subterraneus]